jgi:hypothetical protein
VKCQFYDNFISFSLSIKYVVGDGPELKLLNAMYPDARFVDVRHNKKLARYYSAADVFFRASPRRPGWSEK